MNRTPFRPAVDALEDRTLLAARALGPEFRVNVSPDTREQTRQLAAAVAGDGSFVVVFTAIDSLPGTNALDVYFRRYNRNGRPLTGDVLVNQISAGHQWSPDVAMEDDGSFVVVWQGSTFMPGTRYGIHARRFAAAGTPLGGEFLVSAGFGATDCIEPSVAMDADGDFVVAWTARGDIHARRFTAAGAAAAPAFLVNTVTTDQQGQADVAVDHNGDFVIAWSSRSALGKGRNWGIRARAFTRGGVPRGSEVAVHDPSRASETLPAVAVDDVGNVVVVWQSGNIRARRFDADLDPKGDVFIVNQTFDRPRQFPDVGMDDRGNFVVTWNDFLAPRSVLMRRFDAGGTPLSREEFVPTRATAGHSAQVGVGPLGDIVVAWAGPRTHVSARYYRENRAPRIDPSGRPRLTPVPRGSIDPPGDLVGAVAGGAVTDADRGAKKGIAVVGTTSDGGRWEYSLDGQRWWAVPAVSPSQALLLRFSDRVRFVPRPGFPGTATISFRAWDRTTGKAGALADLGDPDSTGGATAFSIDEESATVRVG